MLWVNNMLLKELQTRDVINVVDGSKLGRLTDLEIDFATGKINSITISRNKGLSGFFGNDQINLSWDKIVKIGGEVIIVNCS